MDIFDSNYFDVIALSSSQCIQPSDCSIRGEDGFDVDLWQSNLYGDESSCYTELTSATTYSSGIPTSYETESYVNELDQLLIFDYDDAMSVTTFDNLPDKTFMCNDSCSQFLKESSEILRVSSLKFQQKDDEELLNVVGTMNVVGDGGKGSDEKFHCSFGDCKKTYSKPAHLRAHLRRHFGIKSYFCNFPNCSWKFSRSDELGK